MGTQLSPFSIENEKKKRITRTLIGGGSQVAMYLVAAPTIIYKYDINVCTIIFSLSFF